MLSLQEYLYMEGRICDHILHNILQEHEDCMPVFYCQNKTETKYLGVLDIINMYPTMNHTRVAFQFPEKIFYC